VVPKFIWLAVTFRMVELAGHNWPLATRRSPYTQRTRPSAPSATSLAPRCVGV